MSVSARRMLVVAVTVSLCGALPATGEAASQRSRNLIKPRISGSPVVGAILSASKGRWSRHPARYRFRWLVCDNGGPECRQLRGATKRRHRLGGRDLGHRLRVRVGAVRRARGGKMVVG